MSGLDAGTLERKEQLLEASFGAMGSRARKRLSRRDVPTSRRQLEICTSSFKVQMAQKLGYREAYERGHGIPEQSDTDFEEVPGICTVFHF